MTQVTKESLAEKIKYLESVSKLGLSLNEEYQLAAYRMLLSFMVGAVAADDLIQSRSCK